MKKIKAVKIHKHLDTTPDTSFLGSYTDSLDDGVIVREAREYVERLPDDYAIPNRSREFRGFKPYASGEPIGSENYYTYGLRDFDRMESLQAGHWSLIGIQAEATIVTSSDGKTWQEQTILSGGLWGIESDSDRDYFKEVAGDELTDLKDTLKQLGFSTRQIKRAFAHVEEVEVD